ncbi:MAG: methylmalonyl-CoA mutase subunit beta [Beijerinckiaceae bacterium]
MSYGTADEFPSADEALWRALALSVLKGRPFDRLVSRSYDDIAIEPLYARPKNVLPRVLRRTPGDWRIAQRMDHPAPFDANRQALRDLAEGADALVLVGSEAAAGRSFGVTLADERDLASVLSGIDLDLVPLRLDLGPQTPIVAQWLLDLAHERHFVAAGLDVDIGFDPLGELLRKGGSPLSVATIGRIGAELSAKLRDAGFAGRVFLADGRPFHEAGASQAQELALVLAAGVAYLRMLEANGLALEAGFSEIGFLLVADADEFMTIAKFRALRHLWARIASACGSVPIPARVHAETAWRMQTSCDPWVNILRNSLAAFSAGIGGADAIAVLPFTSALGLADEFARRIARNSQLILLRESHLGSVADPAAGAGSFEALTEALCEKAWSLFQMLEAAGGLIASLEASLPQAWIAATAEARKTALAQRSKVLTGTSEFPNLGETPVAVLAPCPPGPDTPAAASRYPQLRVAPLPSHRDSEIFEALRQASAAEFADHGVQPKVFLVNFGAPSGFLARHNFAAALFAVAGLDAVPDEGFTSIEAVCSAFAASAAKLACICAADAQLQSEGKALISALQAAGARNIFVVAEPHAPGVADLSDVTFLHRGCDIVAVLQNALASALGT